jgi:hypothetical protein
MRRGGNALPPNLKLFLTTSYLNPDEKMATDIEPVRGTEQNLLDIFEIRILAVLAEKEVLTPDTYPLSLNALTNGCNQLSSRDPVMSISESTVQDTLDRLVQRKLVAEVSQAGARVPCRRRVATDWSYSAAGASGECVLGK